MSCGKRGLLQGMFKLSFELSSCPNMHCLVIYYFILCWIENWHLALCSAGSLNKSESQPEPLCETSRKSHQSSLMVKLTITFIFVCRWCPRGPTCRASAPQTGEDTEVATPEAEDVVTVPRATRTALEEGSGTRQPDPNIKRPTLTTEAPQWGRDSGDTWNTMNNLNVTHVFCSSPHRQRSWGQGPVDSTTLNSASSTHSTHTTVGE